MSVLQLAQEPFPNIQQQDCPKTPTRENRIQHREREPREPGELLKQSEDCGIRDKRDAGRKASNTRNHDQNCSPVAGRAGQKCPDGPARR